MDHAHALRKGRDITVRLICGSGSLADEGEFSSWPSEPGNSGRLGS